MELIPIKTRRLDPPQDDLYAVLDAYLTDVREKDVVLISSKVVAIHQGRCVPMEGTDKAQLVQQEADHVIDRAYYKFPLTIKYHTFVASAGIDESNSGGYYSLLPERPFASAKEIWSYLKEKHNLTTVGVIITDSHLEPLRFGCVGVSIGFWGIEPVEFHRGRYDLFGRMIEVSSTNVIDSLAAAASLEMGEVDECQPVVVARAVPSIRFTDIDRRHSFLIEPQNDMFRVLFEDKLSESVSRQTTTAYLGLGANLDSTFGSPPETLTRAVAAIEAAGIAVIKQSPLYKTAPVPISADPWYYNQVIEVETTLNARELLAALNQVESDFGRVRTEQNAPRVLDLDIIAFGGYLIHDNALSIPHPRFTQRAFVLYPLRDIAPEWRHPMTGTLIDELVAALPAGQEIEKLHE